MTGQVQYRPTGRDVALVFFKRKWSALAIVLIAVLGTSAYLLLIREDLYEVTAEIMVRGAQAQEPPPNLSDSGMAVGGYKFQEVAPEAEILGSTELITRIVDRFHLDQPDAPVAATGFFGVLRARLKAAAQSLRNSYKEAMIAMGLKERLSPREEAVASLQKAFAAVPVKDTNMIALKLDLPFRHGASQILNSWIEQYEQYRSEVYLGRTGKEFFQDQVTEAGSKLQSAEDQLRTFDGSNELSDPAKQEAVLLDEKSRAEELLQESRIAEQQVEDRITAFAREAGKPDPQFVVLGSAEKDTLLGDLLSQLASLQREREHLRLTDLDTSPRIQNNRAQFQQLLEMATKHLNALLDQRKHETAERTTELSNLQQRLAAVHSLSIDQTRLRRNIASNEGEYTTLLKRYDEARATAALDQTRIAQIAVVSRAIDPLTPLGVPKSYLLLAAVLAGVLLALLWLTLAEFLDDGIYTASALESKLNAPVIATLT